MKRYEQEEIRQSVQTIADAYLSMYETMQDQKTVTIADDAVIKGSGIWDFRGKAARLTMS